MIPTAIIVFGELNRKKIINNKYKLNLKFKSVFTFLTNFYLLLVYFGIFLRLKNIGLKINKI